MNPCKIKIFLAILLCLGLILLAFVSYYISASNYYGSVNIQIPKKHKENIKIVSYSPLNNKMDFFQNDSIFYYDSKRFYKSLYITANSISSSDEFIEIYFNQKVLKLPLNDNSIFYEVDFSKLHKYRWNTKIVDFTIFFLTRFQSALVFLLSLIIISLVFFKRKTILHNFTTITKFLYRNKIGVIIAELLLLTVITSFFYNEKLTNYVLLSSNPDQLEYQTCAVNQALGYGFLIGGTIDKNVNYRLEDPDNEVIKQFSFFHGVKRLDRFPAYSYCVGIIYKMFGCSPIIIKYLQLLLLIAILVIIPFFANKLWGKDGFLAAVVSIPFIYFYLFHYVSDITPDLVTVFINFFIIVYSFKTVHKFSYTNVIILSLLLGVSFLFKASLIIYFILLFSYFLLSAFKNPKSNFIKVVLFLLVFLSCWVPYNIWSIAYCNSAKAEATEILESLKKQDIELASINYRINNLKSKFYKNSGEITITADDINFYHSIIEPSFRKWKYLDFDKVIPPNYIGDKSGIKTLIKLEYINSIPSNFFMIYYGYKTAGLSINNEYNHDGAIHPEWSSSKSSFYNNDKLTNRSETYRIANFYLHNPDMIFSITNAKLNSYFSKIYHITIFILAVFVFIIFTLAYRTKEYRSSAKLFRILLGVGLLGLSAGLFLINCITPYMFLLCLLFCFYDKTLNDLVPKPLLFMFINLSLIPVLMYGNPRYMVYYDVFIFIITPIIVLKTIKILSLLLRIEPLEYYCKLPPK